MKRNHSEINYFTGSEQKENKMAELNASDLSVPYIVADFFGKRQDDLICS